MPVENMEIELARLAGDAAEWGDQRSRGDIADALARSVDACAVLREPCADLPEDAAVAGIDGAVRFRADAEDVVPAVGCGEGEVPDDLVGRLGMAVAWEASPPEIVKGHRACPVPHMRRDHLLGLGAEVFGCAAEVV